MADQKHELTRLDFMKGVARSVVLVGVGAGGYAVWTNATKSLARPRAKDDVEGVPNYSVAIDIEKCIGCGLCVEACSKENDVPPGHFRTWIERYIVTADGKVTVSSPDGGIHGFPNDLPEGKVERAFYVPKLCNHCAESPCEQVCPVGATFKTEDGVVLVDYDWCVGCRYCIQACPYGSRFWNPRKNTADKCTFCYHRIKKGLLPACVEVCPTQARVFGDLKDPESPVSQFLAKNAVMTIKPHLKAGAKVSYKGLSREVV